MYDSAQQQVGLLSLDNYIPSICTVKPVYNGHSIEKQTVAVVGRWPLYRGSKFSRPFHLFSFIQYVFRFEGILKRIVIPT